MAKKEVLSPRDHDQWIELCKWIEINLFNYDGEKQKLQRGASLALDGLRKGQNIANNEDDTYGEYPLNVILMTFKANKILIQNAIRNKNFETETHKMIYICTIVRDRLNDMYSRYLNAQKTKEKVELVDTSTMTNKGAEYQVSKRKTNKRLEGLW